MLLQGAAPTQVVAQIQPAVLLLSVALTQVVALLQAAVFLQVAGPIQAGVLLQAGVLFQGVDLLGSASRPEHRKRVAGRRKLVGVARSGLHPVLQSEAP